MSDHDRGAYTPPSDRLAFDPREPVRSGPAPVTLIVSALVLIGLVGGVAFVYRHGTRHPGAAPAEVGAPVADKTVSPDQGSNATSLSVQRVPANAMPNFAPGPEEPALRPGQGAAALPAVSSNDLPPVTMLQPPPAPPKAATNTVTAAVKLAKPLTIASLADAAVSKPAAKPKPKPATLTPVQTPAVSAAAEPAGAGWVQIGAFSSSSLAATGWNDVAKLQPAAMKGKGRKVETVSAGGKTLYRTYITGFASKPAAQAFCDKLKAAGKSCFVK